MKDLHPTQLRLLEMLKNSVDDPMTISQLQTELQLSSTSVVHHHILQLERKGYLKRNPGNPRDYQILSEPEKPIVYLNYYGQGQCGPDGLMLDGNPVSRIPIANTIVRFPVANAFMLKARGNSMEPKITEGDYVIVEKTNGAKKGDIIVCVNNGVVLIKQYLPVGNTFALLSFNKDSKEIIPAPDFKIEGIVRNVISFTF